jgi:biotin carboxylase
MNILILHRIPYHKINYHRGINHAEHQVVYLGTEQALASIPQDLPCIRWARPGAKATYLEAIAAVEQQDIQFNLVLSLSEYELLDAAKVREKFNIKGASIADVTKVRDKLIMKKCASSAGLLVPKNLPLDDFLAQENLLSGALVLKPVDGASSENVQIYTSSQQLHLACTNSSTGIPAVDNKNYAGFQVEEFVEGDILHFDGLVVDGNVKLVLASRYLGNCLAYTTGNPLGSYQLETTEAHKHWVDQVLKATSLANGSFHIEAIQNGNELVFLELANRVGGADVVDAVEQATGIHMPSVELQIYLGSKPDLVINQSNSKFGWFVFPGHHLNEDYCHIQGADSFRQHSQVIRWNQLASHAALTKHITYQATEVPIAGLVKGKDSNELEQFMQSLFTNVTVSGAHLTESA